MKTNLTLEDIGRLAGVSRSTVSRVVNESESVRPDVRQRVLDETGFFVAAERGAFHREHFIQFRVLCFSDNHDGYAIK